MAKENVQIKATFTGSLEEADRGLENAVNEELMNATGLGRESVTFQGEGTYSAVLKRTESDFSASSSKNVEEALNRAMRQERTNVGETVEVSVQRTAEVPYFTVPVVARSLDPTKLDKYHADGVNELLKTYGNRVNQDPDSAQFRVLKTKQNYKNDAALPKGELKFLDKGESNVSLDDALAKARTGDLKRVQSIVYERVSQMMIYGVAEAALEIKRGVAAPMVITAVKPAPATQTRSGPPAARDPEYFESANALM